MSSASRPAESGTPSPARSTPAAILRRQIRAFTLWDGGMSAFSSVILTFVFATYVTQGVASAGVDGIEQVRAAQAHGAEVLSSAQAWAAATIALLAPLLGNLADSGGRRNVLMAVTTLGTVATIALMPLVAPDRDDLVLGAVLIAVAVVFSELAGVFVNSVLPEISTPHDRGRISGTAWAVGYWGSIGCLALVLVLFVMPGTGLLGLSADGAWNLRAIPVFVAIWVLVGTLPLLRHAPRHPSTEPAARWSPWQGYATIVRRVVRAFRDEPVTLAYLVASAIYRDGLGAVFSLAGVLAATAYGFSTTEVILFGIAANLVAGFGVYLGGKVDDRLGSRTVILAGVCAIIALGVVVVIFSPPIVFWVCGIAISFFVGPVQSASRNLLTRVSVPGHETENFGLYATTGRAFGFLGTGAFAVAVHAFGDTRMGMVGILAVLVLGVVAFAPIPLGAAGRPAPVSPPGPTA